MIQLPPSSGGKGHPSTLLPRVSACCSCAMHSQRPPRSSTPRCKYVQVQVVGKKSFAIISPSANDLYLRAWPHNLFLVPRDHLLRSLP